MKEIAHGRAIGYHQFMAPSTPRPGRLLNGLVALKAGLVDFWKGYTQNPVSC